MLTAGKRSGQGQSLPGGSEVLTVNHDDVIHSERSADLLCLRWAALLLYLLPNIDGYVEQLRNVLSLN